MNSPRNALPVGLEEVHEAEDKPGVSSLVEAVGHHGEGAHC